MEVIGTAEAGRRLGIGAKRVWVLIHTRRLKAIRVGRDWVIDPADLAAVAVRRPGRPPKPRD